MKSKNEIERLIVVLPFDDYRRGNEITDKKIIKEVLKKHSEKVHIFFAK